MGTNYYLHRNTCDHCGRSDEPMHIGKSSGGWCFSLHVIPEHNINDLPDWEREWANGIIKNEYGDTLLAIEMRDHIIERCGSTPWEEHTYGNGPLEYVSEAVMLKSNHAERGPNNLLRNQIGDHCIGHGAGTWDLIEGYFS